MKNRILKVFVLLVCGVSMGCASGAVSALKDIDRTSALWHGQWESDQYPGWHGTVAIRIPENLTIGQEVDVPVAVGYSPDSTLRPGKIYVARFKGVLVNSRSGRGRYDPATPQRPVDPSTLDLTIVEGTYDIPETFSITFNETMNMAKGYWKTSKGNRGTFTLKRD